MPLTSPRREKRHLLTSPRPKAATPLPQGEGIGHSVTSIARFPCESPAFGAPLLRGIKEEPVKELVCRLCVFYHRGALRGCESVCQPKHRMCVGHSEGARRARGWTPSVTGRHHLAPPLERVRRRRGFARLRPGETRVARFPHQRPFN